jgi:hypothetical protein
VNSIRALIAGVVVLLLVAGGAFWLTRDGDDFPYTSQKMTDAQIDCAGEYVAAATPSEQRQAVAESFSSDNLQPCLRDKLPELTRDQVEDIDDLIAERRSAELQKELDD